jgi:hypothetical protein
MVLSRGAWTAARHRQMEIESWLISGRIESGRKRYRAGADGQSQPKTRDRKRLHEGKEGGYHRMERAYGPSSAPPCCPPQEIKAALQLSIKTASSGCGCPRLEAAAARKAV